MAGTTEQFSFTHPPLYKNQSISLEELKVCSESTCVLIKRTGPYEWAITNNPGAGYKPQVLSTGYATAGDAIAVALEHLELIDRSEVTRKEANQLLHRASVVVRGGE